MRLPGGAPHTPHLFVHVSPFSEPPEKTIIVLPKVLVPPDTCSSCPSVSCASSVGDVSFGSMLALSSDHLCAICRFCMSNLPDKRSGSGQHAPGRGAVEFGRTGSRV